MWYINISLEKVYLDSRFKVHLEEGQVITLIYQTLSTGSP